MLIVTKQHRVHFSDGVGANGGAGCLHQCHMRQPVFSGPVESRVGKEPEPGDFDESSRTAD